MLKNKLKLIRPLVKSAYKEAVKAAKDAGMLETMHEEGALKVMEKLDIQGPWRRGEDQNRSKYVEMHYTQWEKVETVGDDGVGEVTYVPTTYLFKSTNRDNRCTFTAHHGTESLKMAEVAR